VYHEYCLLCTIWDLASVYHLVLGSARPRLKLCQLYLQNNEHSNSLSVPIMWSQVPPENLKFLSAGIPAGWEPVLTQINKWRRSHPLVVMAMIIVVRTLQIDGRLSPCPDSSLLDVRSQMRITITRLTASIQQQIVIRIWTTTNHATKHNTV